MHTARADSRNQSEEDAGHHGKAHGKRQDRQVRCEGNLNGVRRSGQPAEQRPAAPIGEHSADGSGDEAEQKAFGEKLTYKSPPTGADGETEGDFTAPCRATRQQQRGHVGAGQQQHETGRREQRP